MIGEFAAPDRDSLGWSPAEHVIVHPNGQEMEPVAEFYAPDAGSEGGASVIEFGLDDVTLDSLLVESTGQDTDSFSLSELLESVEIAPELAPISSADEAGLAQSDVGDGPGGAKLPDVSHVSAALEFPALTVVIDDDPGSDTVAL